MKNKTAYLFIAAAVIFFVLDTFQKLQYSPDDTYIYMQYARNISGGGGFSFNYGERLTDYQSVVGYNTFCFIFSGLNGFLPKFLT
jgi:hypothetical protein